MNPNLNAARKQTRLLRVWCRRACCVVAAVVALAIVAWLLLPCVPVPLALSRPPVHSVDLLDREGRSLRLAHAEGEPFQQRVAYAELPAALIHATLAAEDARFWEHPGVDWRGSLRALGQLIWHRRIVSGGSTITQQLIKQAEPRPRTFRTKVIEAVKAFRLEQAWDKQRILTEYLHRVDYGNLNGGAPAAARFYFGKLVRDLSPAECALLAALPRAPSRLNPLRHPERAQRRQYWILAQMLRRGWLTEEEHDRAVREPLRLVGQRQFVAPHFVELVLDQEPPVARPAATVRTTLDRELQRAAEQAVRRQLALLQAQNVHDAAVVVLDNASGGVRALVGSPDFFSPRAGQVNGTWAPRSAGSTFKPFAYALALEAGASPATVIADVPVVFATSTGLFEPVNYDRHFRGPVTLREALACSLNIPAVRTLEGLGGPAPLLARLRACGLTTLTNAPEHYGLGLTIGNAEARLLEMANAFACLARLGTWQPWRCVESAGPPIAKQERIFSAEAAWWIADILSDNAARAAAFGLDSALRFDFPVACKTGTSSDFRDNWAFGYTPEFTVGVWVGNFDGSPMRGVSGVTGAAPILHEVIEKLHQRFGSTWYAPPPGLVEVQVNRLNGKQLADSANPLGPGLAVREKFFAGKLPPLEKTGDRDAEGRVRLPAVYGAWFASGANTLSAVATVAEAKSPPRIAFPPPGTEFVLNPDLPDHGRRVGLRAEGAGTLAWSSATLAIETNNSLATLVLAPGRHEVELRELKSGTTARTWITVRE